MARDSCLARVGAGVAVGGAVGGAVDLCKAVYWLVTYSGYARDLSPKVAFELLSGKDSAVLVDVRPEDLRQKDGVPDLRRAARFRYADVSLPKVDDSVRKLTKSNRELDDMLIAAVKGFFI